MLIWTLSQINNLHTAHIYYVNLFDMSILSICELYGNNLYHRLFPREYAGIHPGRTPQFHSDPLSSEPKTPQFSTTIISTPKLLQLNTENRLVQHPSFFLCWTEGFLVWNWEVCWTEEFWCWTEGFSVWNSRSILKRKVFNRPLLGRKLKVRSYKEPNRTTPERTLKFLEGQKREVL